MSASISVPADRYNTQGRTVEQVNVNLNIAPSGVGYLVIDNGKVSKNYALSVDAVSTLTDYLYTHT